MKLTLEAGPSKDIQEMTYDFNTHEVKFELIDGNHFYNLLKGRKVDILTPFSIGEYMITELSFTEEMEEMTPLKIYQIKAQELDFYYKVEAEKLRQLKYKFNPATATTKELEDAYNGR